MPKAPREGSALPEEATHVEQVPPSPMTLPPAPQPEVGSPQSRPIPPQPVTPPPAPQPVEEKPVSLPPEAYVFNFLLSPLLMPSYMTLIIFSVTILSVIAPGATLPYTLTVLGATCLAPLIAIFIMERIGVVKSMALQERRDRAVPYIIEFLGLGAVTLFFIYKGAAPWLWSIYLGGAAVSIVNLLINFHIKISSHCSGLAAMIAAFVVVNGNGFPQVSLFWWVVGTALLAGVAGFIAIYYRRHTVWEVLAGYATGYLGIILFSLIK